MVFHQGPRAMVYVALPQFYSRNIKALLFRPDWEKDSQGVLCLSCSGCCGFSPFLYYKLNFLRAPSLFISSVHSVCLMLQGFLTQWASTDSPITLAELLVVWDCILPQLISALSLPARACFSFDFGPLCCSVNNILVGSRKVSLLFFCLCFLVRLGVMLFLALYMPPPLLEET